MGPTATQSPPGRPRRGSGVGRIGFVAFLALSCSARVASALFFTPATLTFEPAALGTVQVKTLRLTNETAHSIDVAASVAGTSCPGGVFITTPACSLAKDE